MIKVPKSDRNWLGLVFPNVYDVVEEKREYVLEILNRINLERKSVKAFFLKNRHKAQRKAKFYINKCRSASCMQSGLKQASA